MRVMDIIIFSSLLPYSLSYHISLYLLANKLKALAFMLLVKKEVFLILLLSHTEKNI